MGAELLRGGYAMYQQLITIYAHTQPSDTRYYDNLDPLIASDLMMIRHILYEYIYDSVRISSSLTGICCVPNTCSLDATQPSALKTKQEPRHVSFHH